MKNTTATAALRDDKHVTLAVDPASSALTVQQVLGQVALIQQIMTAAMKDGEHFGRIPGCGTKPTLLKPGAEKLCLTFQLAAAYEVQERGLDSGHREYQVRCILSSRITERFFGQGVGLCTTQENKYRFRQHAAEPTDKPVPRAYWDVRAEDPAKAQELIGGKGFSVKKVEGKGWMIAKGGDKIEHDNPADHYNTVLKMAKKRALVDAVLTATAASDIFTQDLEDITANLALTAPALAPTLVTAPTPAAASAPMPGRDTLHRDRPIDVTPEKDSVPAPVAVEDYQSEPDMVPVGRDSSLDFRETRIHFGKNRGLMLSELSPQQVHWYESEWMPKKEVNGPTSVEDLSLMNALKAYGTWRSGSRSGGKPAEVKSPSPRTRRPIAVHDEVM